VIGICGAPGSLDTILLEYVGTARSQCRGSRNRGYIL